MKYSNAVLLFISCSMFIALINSLAVAADTAFDRPIGIQACMYKVDDSERLECFDRLAATLYARETDISATENESEVTSDALPEKLGGREFYDTRVKQVESRGLVKSCKKSYDGKWFFIFENGQVWKQVGTGSRRYKDCGFYVTIKKDGFGYKMQIDGQTRKIRIRRHK